MSRALTIYLAVLWLWPTALLACDGGSAKREAAALTEAVDRFSKVSGQAQAKAVDDVSCTDERVCEAKRACVAAIDPTARALALKDEVAAKLADIEAARLAPDAAAAEELPGKLDAATRSLREGHSKMHECDTKLTDLKLTYGF